MSWQPITENAQRYPEDDVWICNLNANTSVYYHRAFEKIPNRYTHFMKAEKPKAPKKEKL